MSIRDEIMAELVSAAREGMALGAAMPRYVMEKFPGTPEIVATEAWMKAEAADVETWWKSVERTIDGEIIRRALAITASSESE